MDPGDTLYRIDTSPEAVGAACTALQRTGVDPSLRKVRQQLGGGSNTTLLRGLQQWRRQQDPHASETPPPPPAGLFSDLRTLAPSMWTAALEQARHEVRQQLAALERQSQEYQATGNELAQRMDAAESLVEQARSERDESRSREAGATLALHGVRSELVACSDLKVAAITAEREKATALQLAHEQLALTHQYLQTAQAGLQAAHISQATIQGSLTEAHAIMGQMGREFAQERQDRSAQEQRLEQGHLQTVATLHQVTEQLQASQAEAAQCAAQAQLITRDLDRAKAEVSHLLQETHAHQQERESLIGDARMARNSADRWEKMTTGLSAGLERHQEVLNTILARLPSSPPDQIPPPAL